MDNHLLVRYGELSLKKNNRKQFIKKVNQHIKDVLASFSNLQFESKGMRYYIILNGTNPQPIIEILKKIPGIHSFSLVSKAESNIEAIKELALKVMKKENLNGTFKVETNRGDKNFPLTSLTITKEVSKYLFQNIPNLKADMHHPDLILNIDVRYEGTFLFTKIIEGMKGFPSGILGKTMLMISGGIDSIVAGYLTIKKGMDIDAVHFASPPYTSLLALQKVVDLLETLTPSVTNQKINLYIIPFTKMQEAIYKFVREDYGITIMRRMMYRMTEILAMQNEAIVIINGESIGQVASQTLESISVISEVVSMPIIRPLAMLDKQDIINLSQEINTFDISIRPHEDCCTVFVPKHPQIKPRLTIVKREESLFDYQSLIDEAIEKTEKITLQSNKHYQVIGTKLTDLL